MVEAIECATNLVAETLESMGKTCTNDSIRRDVTSWYEHSDIVNPDMLAAGVLEYGSWKLISFDKWEEITEKWFPLEVPVGYGYPNIEELHDSYYDLAWQEGWM